MRGGLRVYSAEALAADGVCDADDWARLERLLDALPRARQTRGDVADHHLEVGLVARSDPRPRVVGAAAARVADWLGAPPRRALFEALVGGPPWLRRAQFNRMGEGDYNRRHRDTDDDPDYRVAAVFFLTDPADYVGGALCVDGAEPLRAPARSLVVFGADVPHALTPVGACRRSRDTLVTLWGAHGGPNRGFRARA